VSTPETATVYSGIRDVEVYVGESSPGERWPGGPYRKTELPVLGAIAVCALAWVDTHPTGTTLPALIVAAALGFVVVGLMRLLLPKGRPSLSTRIAFARNTLHPPHVATTGTAGLRTDASFDPPRKVIDNLVYTKGGVYAEYLIDGLPVLMRSYAVNERAAKLTRNLGRYLPSGALLRGLLVAEDINAIMLNIGGAHRDKPAWVKQCKHWLPIIGNPTQTRGNGYAGPVRTLYWLTIPVDAGTAGRTPLGQGKRLWDWVAGRDKEAQSSVHHYADTARTIIQTLPDEFNIRPATPAQILWHYRHRAGLGTTYDPIPAPGVGPTTLDAQDFPPTAFDEGDNATTPWWRPSGKSLVRVYDPTRPTAAPSYQAFLTIEHFPRQGVRFPRATYLHALSSIQTDAVIEWVQHFNVREPDQAQNVNYWYAKNIKDQMQQRGPRGAFEGDLRTKLDQTKAYVARLKANPAERELDHTVVIAVGARDPDTLDDAVKQIRQELDNIAIAVKRRRGAHAPLWKAFNTGSENASPIDEFRNPTTAHQWSLFLPLVSGRVGNTKGSPLAVDQTTARPAIILWDPEGAARRNKPTGLAVVGDPGGGKSHITKRCELELILRGGRAVIFEPDTIAEHARALRPIEHLGVRFIDPTRNEWCFDPLVIFGPEAAARMATAHILPWIGAPADSLIAKRYRRLVRPDTRDAHGITSHRALLEHLRAQPGADNDELLLRLETAQEDFPGLFDDTLPPYKPDESAATVYLTGNLALPDAEDIVNSHLYLQLSGIQRAGMAIYGLLVDLEQQYMFSRRDRFDVMIFEECAQLVAYPAGARTVHLMTRRGRKHATGVWLITQDFRDLAKMNDKFIVQKWILRITDRELAEATLKWAGIDTDTYPELVTELCENTSPGNTRDDDAFGEAGAVDPHRRGEGFVVDELGRPARARFLGAPTEEQAAAFDSTATVAT